MGFMKYKGYVREKFAFKRNSKTILKKTQKSKIQLIENSILPTLQSLTIRYYLFIFN